MDVVVAWQLGIIFILSWTSKGFCNVGCFLCHSYNGSNPGCTDPFSSTKIQYDFPCRTGLSNRVGLFPAHYCVKMKGSHVHTGIEVVVRTCSVTSMHEQCGMFEYEGKRYNGCLKSCHHSGCNRVDRVQGEPLIVILGLSLIGLRSNWI